MAYAGKIVLITGAASGIGRGLARALGARGAVVIATDIDAAGAAAVAAEITAAGGRAESTVLDVTDDAAIARVFADAVAKHSRLDLVFDNAGVGFAGEFRDASMDHWRRLTRIDLDGALAVAFAAWKQFAAQGSGHLVVTASFAGLVPTPAMSLYGVAKWGLVGL
ncbi:MAG: SDR family oxidoreductase, partial [Gemmatimonadaceae bacterium]|nr:SDR family oxidoreductase [Gemmatimonadaceae bacterium]